MTTIAPVTVYTTGGYRGLAAARVAGQLTSLYNAPLRIRSFVSEPEELELRAAELQRIAESADVASGVEVDVAVTLDPGAALAEPQAATISCMATSAKLLRHEGHFGSYAERALRSADHPLMLIGPRADADLTSITRVVVPVDGSALSEQAVPLGADMANRLDVDLWIVTVVSEAHEAAARSAGITVESGYVRQLARPHQGQYEVLHGDDVATRLLDFAGGHSLIVLTSHGRSGIRRMIAGSVAMALVAEAPTPVVVIPQQRDPVEGGT